MMNDNIKMIFVIMNKKQRLSEEMFYKSLFILYYLF